MLRMPHLVVVVVTVVVTFLSELAEKRSSFLEVERPRPESVTLFCLHSCNHSLESCVSPPCGTHFTSSLHKQKTSVVRKQLFFIRIVRVIQSGSGLLGNDPPDFASSASTRGTYGERIGLNLKLDFVGDRDGAFCRDVVVTTID